VALSLFDARVLLTGPDGDRVLTIDELYRLPGDDPSRDTTLVRGELVTAVELPAASPLTRASTYRKVRDRASYAFALCSVAAAVRLESGVIAEVALAFGGLAAKPWRARLAEQRLVDERLTSPAIAAAVDAELADADPLPRNGFKLPLARRLAAVTLGRSAGVELVPPDGDA
jgi:xanthine dehydrogenase YagS FAD-binding subunit